MPAKSTTKSSPILTYFDRKYTPKRKDELAERTLKTQRACVELFVRFIGTNKRIADITERDLVQFQQWWIDRPATQIRKRRSPESARRITASVRSFVAFVRPPKRKEKPVVRRQREAAADGELARFVFSEFAAAHPKRVPAVAFTVRRFDKFLGRPATLADLDANASEFLEHRFNTVVRYWARRDRFNLRILTDFIHSSSLKG